MVLDLKGIDINLSKIYFFELIHCRAFLFVKHPQRKISLKGKLNNPYTYFSQFLFIKKEIVYNNAFSTTDRGTLPTFERLLIVNMY